MNRISKIVNRIFTLCISMLNDGINSRAYDFLLAVDDFHFAGKTERCISLPVYKERVQRQ